MLKSIFGSVQTYVMIALLTVCGTLLYLNYDLKKDYKQIVEDKAKVDTALKEANESNGRLITELEVRERVNEELEFGKRLLVETIQDLNQEIADLSKRKGSLDSQTVIVDERKYIEVSKVTDRITDYYSLMLGETGELK